METKTVATNRKARHDYHILETLEAGIELRGSEVKSLREAKASLRDAFARVERGELLIYNMHISPYEKGGHFNPDPRRTRRLLVHRREIKKLLGKTAERGLTLVPLRLYFPRGKAIGRRSGTSRGLSKTGHWADQREAVDTCIGIFIGGCAPS